MNSRAYHFQLQAAEAAAAASPIHAEEGDEPEEVTPKALLLKFQAQGTADEPASRQGTDLAPTTMGTIGNAEATKCPECPKWFASEKAMFGHLRKHPERGYKGATRPTATTANASAAAAVAGEKKPSKKVPRKETGTAAVEKKPWEEAELSTKWWPATAKRGRTPVAPVQASSCSEEEEAAMILLELASSSRTSTSETQQQQSVESARATAATSGQQVQIQTSVVVEEPMLLDHPAAHQTPEAAEEQIVQPENALELSAESQTPAAKQVTDLVITTEAVLIVVPASKPIFPSLDSGAGDKKPKKQRRVANPEQTAASASPPPPEGAVVRTPPARRIPSPASNKKHTCPTCGKSFPTHQALGGHMSSHVKGKTTSARNDDLAAAQAMQNILAHRDQSAGNGNGDGDGTGTCTVIKPDSTGAGALQEHQDAQPPPAQAPTPQTAAPHVCDECHLIFPSGQALGGHKRKHWFPEKQQAKAAQPAPPPAPAPRDFDLNEMPEEGQGENSTQP